MPLERAEQELREAIPQFSPFEIEIPRLRIFEKTLVVFGDIGTGRDRLHWMHDSLNSGSLYQKEAYEYYPHITLAHNACPTDIQDIFELASRRWKEEAPTHSFTLETLTFVQNTQCNRWLDLEPYDLRGLAEAQVR